MPDRTSELIEQLHLNEHPEGGYYREIFRSSNLVQRQGAQRSALTNIYYLLSKGQFGRWHGNF